SSPGASDMTVGFGPSVGGGVFSPLAYFHIGSALKIISWNEPFQTRYIAASRETMVRVTTLVLDLTPQERQDLVLALNQILAKQYSKPYQVFLRNCSTMVADLLAQVSDLPRGPLSFIPARLERNLRSHGLSRTVLPSGRDLKRALLVRDAPLMIRAFPDATERMLFENQLMSVQTEFRVLAYKKLEARSGTRDLAARLMTQTESDSRRKTIEAQLAAPGVASVQRFVAIVPGEKFRALRIENHALVVVTEGSQVPAVSAHGSSPIEARKIERRFDLAAMGLPLLKTPSRWELGSQLVKIGTESRLYFWIAKDLGLDN
ncbi:MAG: hypothetical protein ABIR96_03335, partial [Bdellovibrionota bacterium]